MEGRVRSRLLVLVLLALVASCAAVPPQAAGEDSIIPAASQATTRWQKLSVDGVPVGLRKLVSFCDDTRCTTEQTLRVQIQQPGEAAEQTETRLRYVEARDGRPLQATKVQQSRAASHRLAIEYRGQRLWLSQGQAFAPVAGQAVAQFPHQRQRLFAQHAKSGELLTQEWSFAQQAVEAVRYRFTPLNAPLTQALSTALTPWLTVLRWKISKDVQRQGAWQHSAIYYADGDFTVLAQYSESAGQSMWLLPCDEACRAEPLEAMSHVYQRLLRSPYRISDQALNGKVRYQLRGAPSHWQPPGTGQQSVQKEGNDWLVTVCKHCELASPEAAPVDDYLGASYWLPAKASAFAAVVDELIGQAPIAPAVKMQRLTRFVSGYMDEVATYSGYATALQAMESAQGDCTEHALMLAALARAAGIPSRVVMGVAYNNERFLGRRFVFVPHMWVEAWTGERWENFDSALGPFSAGHIALAVSHGDQADFLAMNALLDGLRIVSAVQLKSRVADTE